MFFVSWCLCGNFKFINSYRTLARYFVRWLISLYEYYQYLQFMSSAINKICRLKTPVINVLVVFSVFAVLEKLYCFQYNIIINN